jgi:predicted metal-binding membrane protein
MSSTSMMSPVMTASMMVAMMLPSITPTLWRHRRHLRATRTLRAGRRTTLFALGYASVWTTIGLALSALSAELSRTRVGSPMNAPFAPSIIGAVILCAGILQRSRWKEKQLLRCRQACAAPSTVSKSVMSALGDGSRLGLDCGLSCAAPMAVLFVTGIMDARMMLVITAAITAERVGPSGARIARLTGALAMIAGSVMCVRAIGPSMPKAAYAATYFSDHQLGARLARCQSRRLGRRHAAGKPEQIRTSGGLRAGSPRAMLQ